MIWLVYRFSLMFTILKVIIFYSGFVIAEHNAIKTFDWTK